MLKMEMRDMEEVGIFVVTVGLGIMCAGIGLGFLIHVVKAG